MVCLRHAESKKCPFRATGRTGNSYERIFALSSSIRENDLFRTDVKKRL